MIENKNNRVPETGKSVDEYVRALLNAEQFHKQITGHRLIEAKTPVKILPPESMCPQLVDILKRLGIVRLFSHQVEALAAIRDGRHTVVATPTASGKSLIYNLALFDALITDGDARALYLFPLKALSQDQLTVLDHWREAAAPVKAEAAVYDGDTSAYRRKKIRLAPPTVIMTNPEMVHLSILAHHHLWSSFLRHLKLVVIDEVHAYRGVPGSHMAQVFQRLHRICAFYGAAPVFIFASATVTDPSGLADSLSGLKTHAVTKSGAGQGKRHSIIINPENSPAQTAILLVRAAMARKLRTIVYTKSRKQAELITLWVQSRKKAQADKISVYRAGLTPLERRDIEKRLKAGELLTVISTSALELGIDIGDLDLCILVGYPGSMIATWQRSGRVGRQGQDAALVLIAGQDSLDQYFVANPAVFWDGKPEQVVLNPYNETILGEHLVCAAAEMPMETREAWINHPQVARVVAALEQNGAVIRSADGLYLFTNRKRPHQRVHLRGSGHCYRIVDHDTLRPIGEVDAFRVYRETHPGAVYLHQGKTYVIQSIDEQDRSVHARLATIAYYTRVRSGSDVIILDKKEVISINNTDIYYGKVKVKEHVTGYDRLQNATGALVARVALSVPPVVYDTEAFWIEMGATLYQGVRDEGFDLSGSLHAAEHAIIGMMPLMLLIDRNDLGGLATPFHPEVGKAVIFIYDGIAGGAGLSRAAFEQAPVFLHNALEGIRGCDCESGCPGCIHSPKCGSGNQPLDKKGAIFLLRRILKPGRRIIRPQSQPKESITRPAQGQAARMIHYGVFDLETQQSAEDVGGWRNAHLMRLSCGVVYDSMTDQFDVFMEDQVNTLIEKLSVFELVIGFNCLRFDYRVLSGYCDFDFRRLPTLDLLDAIYERLGFRLSLDHLARHTLNATKAGSGLDALVWWREGKVDELVSYCRLDVKLTRDLYLFAMQNGYLVYQDKTGKALRAPLADLHRRYARAPRRTEK